MTYLCPICEIDSLALMSFTDFEYSLSRAVFVYYCSQWEKIAIIYNSMRKSFFSFFKKKGKGEMKIA